MALECAAEERRWVCDGAGPDRVRDHWGPPGRHQPWSSAGPQPEEAHGIPRVDRRSVLRREPGRVEVRDRRLDRARGAERHVGAEQHLVWAEELEDAADRMRRAEEG